MTHVTNPSLHKIVYNWHIDVFDEISYLSGNKFNEKWVVVELGRLRWTTSVLIRVPSCIFNWKFHWAIKDNFLLLILKFENFKEIFYFEGHFQTLNCIASNAWICLYANSSWQNTSNSARTSYMQGVLPGYMLSDNMGGVESDLSIYKFN